MTCNTSTCVLVKTEDTLIEKKAEADRFNKEKLLSQSNIDLLLDRTLQEKKREKGTFICHE